MTVRYVRWARAVRAQRIGKPIAHFANKLRQARVKTDFKPHRDFWEKDNTPARGGYSTDSSGAWSDSFANTMRTMRCPISVRR